MKRVVQYLSWAWYYPVAGEVMSGMCREIRSDTSQLTVEISKRGLAVLRTLPTQCVHDSRLIAELLMDLPHQFALDDVGATGSLMNGGTVMCNIIAPPASITSQHMSIDEADSLCRN
jgi:hypothetical protein